MLALNSYIYSKIHVSNKDKKNLVSIYSARTMLAGLISKCLHWASLDQK